MPAPSAAPSNANGTGPASVAPIPLRDAVLALAGSWFLGSILSSIVAQSSGHTKIADTPAGWILLAQLALWAPMVAAAWYVGSRHGTGNLVRDYSYRVRPIDLAGIPLGAAVQLGVLPLLYWPLGHAWPDTFGRSHLEKPARDLWNNAHGLGVLAIVFVAVVGAPLVEELMYRGLLQGAFVRCTDRITGLLIVGVWFAAIHFQPVQMPGLLLIGLVLGVVALRTGRLGMAVLTHMAFNATGLVLVAR